MLKPLDFAATFTSAELSSNLAHICLRCFSLEKCFQMSLAREGSETTSYRAMWYLLLRASSANVPWLLNYLFNVLMYWTQQSSFSQYLTYFYYYPEFLFILDLWYPWEHLWEQQQNRPCSLLSCLQGDLSVYQMPPEAAGKELLQAACKNSSARYSKHSHSGWNLYWSTVTQEGNPQTCVLLNFTRGEVQENAADKQSKY